MRGLKTQETPKFVKFFSEVVQREAMRQGSIFFLEAGDGREFENEEIEGEDLQGWLVPLQMADQFEKRWREGVIEEKWMEFFCWAIWKKDTQGIGIDFKNY